MLQFQCRTKYKVQVRLKDFPGLYARLEYMIDKKAIRLHKIMINHHNNSIVSVTKAKLYILGHYVT